MSTPAADSVPGGNPPSPKIRVLLVDDHIVFREGLANLLNAEPDIEVRLHCRSVDEALVLAAAQLADVVVLDLDLGSERGVDFLEKARAVGFRGSVVVLAAAVSSLERSELERYGVAAILKKEESVESVATAIRDGVTKVLHEPPASGSATASHLNKELTARETAVLRLVFEGLGNKEIAHELGISETSVKAALQQLFHKTGVRTRGQLVRAALEHYREFL